MATLKIFLDKDESIEDSEEMIRKALELHSSGDVHVEESFDDPAMIHTSERLSEIHEKIYDEMLMEIIEELNKEY